MSNDVGYPGKTEEGVVYSRRPQRTQQQFTTEFLASQRQRAREGLLTSLAWRWDQTELLHKAKRIVVLVKTDKLAILDATHIAEPKFDLAPHCWNIASRTVWKQESGGFSYS